jgi:hypothetical protein
MSAEGMADYQAFNQCLQTNCSGATTNDEFYACLEEFCMDTYYGCFWGCTYETCGGLIDCLGSCPDDDPSTPDVDERSECTSNCWGEATTEAQIGLQDAIECSNDACPVCDVANPTQQQIDECNTCWDTATSETCVTYWDACTSYGTGNCNQLWSCYMACADQACSQACIDAADKEARELLQDVFDCINTNCDVNLPEQDWIDCANASINTGGACEGSVNACMTDGSD